MFTTKILVSVWFFTEVNSFFPGAYTNFVYVKKRK